jgi:hypothetical protein
MWCRDRHLNVPAADPGVQHWGHADQKLAPDLLQYVSTRTLDSDSCREADEAAPADVKFTVLAEHRAYRTFWLALLFPIVALM